MNVFGYETKTTFWQDFEFAEIFGYDAIKDTYNRALEEWKENTIYLTELVMVLNWKSFYWYDTNEDFSELYANLYCEADNYALNNLKGEDLKYYLKTTD